jgi:hypothetical protein
VLHVPEIEHKKSVQDFYDIFCTRVSVNSLRTEGVLGTTEMNPRSRSLHTPRTTYLLVREGFGLALIFSSE